MNSVKDKQSNNDRLALLQEFNKQTDGILIFLSLVWIILLILEFTVGLTHFLEILSYTIWGIFILDFLLEFYIAPKKLPYLKSHWLTVISLVLPAFRFLKLLKFLKILKVARSLRSVSLVRLITSINRGIRTIRTSVPTRGIGYVIALSTLILFVVAAGILYFENPQQLAQNGISVRNDQPGIRNYGDALWWTAMLMTTSGSDYWPKTGEGRILTFILSLYAFAVFGYITATIAALLIGNTNKR